MKMGYQARYMTCYYINEIYILVIKNLKTELTTTSWHAIWKYIRTAPTLPVVRVRLDEILIKFP
jgi:hypothetical protein